MKSPFGSFVQKPNDLEIAKKYFDTDRPRAIEILENAIKTKPLSNDSICKYKMSLATLYSLSDSVKQVLDVMQSFIDMFLQKKIKQQNVEQLFAELFQQAMEKNSKKYNFIKTYELYFLTLTKQEQKAKEILNEISPFFQKKFNVSDIISHRMAMLFYQVRLMAAYNSENNEEIIYYARKLCFSSFLTNNDISSVQLSLGLAMEYFKRKSYTKAMQYFDQVSSKKDEIREIYFKYVFNSYIVSFVLIDENTKAKLGIEIDMSKVQDADEIYQKLLILYQEKKYDDFENFLTAEYESFPENIAQLLTQKSIELLNQKLNHSIFEHVSGHDRSNPISLETLGDEIDEDKDDVKEQILKYSVPDTYIDSKTNEISMIPSKTKDTSQLKQRLKKISAESVPFAKMAKIKYTGVI